MNRSKKKEQKRREEYNKAVKHKMESAADLADKYAKDYEISKKDKNKVNNRVRKIVNRKLFLILGSIALQTIVLFTVVMLVFLPFKNGFKNVLENYFSKEKPEFISGELSEEFIGSENESEKVYYTHVEMPDFNCCYAVISTEKFSSKIYYGVSEEALLSGVGHISVTSVPGFGKPVLLYGYSNTYFQGVQSVAEGDIFTVNTNYGVYKYQVSGISVFDSDSEAPYDLGAEKEQLIICTDYPFDAYKTESEGTYCVIADKISGPEVIY